MTDTDYTGDIALLANAPTQAESLLQSHEQPAGSISSQGIASRTEFMRFKQKAISAFSNKPLKLVDQFTYLCSNISSTESDVDILLAKEWTTIDRFKWKSDLSDKIKQDFFQAVTVSVLFYGCTTWMLTKHIEKKLNEKQHPTMATYLPFHRISK